jgi:integrase
MISGVGGAFPRPDPENPAMGDVFRQQFRKKDGSRGESRKWYGQYRDHAGKLRRVPLAADKGAARAMLAELVRQVERRRAGLADDFTEAAASPLAELRAAYLADLKLRGRKERYRVEVEQLLTIIVEACGFRTPGDLRSEALDVYLAGMEGTARTRAKHRQSVVGFANWMVRKGKLPANPLQRSTRPEGEQARKRRALSAEELRALVAAAEARPLLEGTLIRWGPRAGSHDRRLPEAERERLRVQGRNNALLYRTAFYTGLRADELRSLWAGDLTLDGEHPRLLLPKERTKNKKDALCPLPRRLAADLGAWVADRGIGPAEPVFRVPRDTAKLLRADLAAAGIEYRDARGRVADFHSLRMSLSTHLGAGGVGPTTRQGLMRHSDVRLSLQTYHDEAMDDARAAVEGLPEV